MRDYCIAGIARVEVIAAISRKRRMGELTGAAARTLVAQFESDPANSSQRYFVVGVTDPIVELASEIVVSHGLRVLDSIQLASAIEVRDADRGARHSPASMRDLPKRSAPKASI